MKKLILTILGCIATGTSLLFFYNEIFSGPTKTQYGKTYPLPLEVDLQHTVRYFTPVEIQLAPHAPIVYPWKNYTLAFSPITKEYFRCRGSSLNPPIPVYQDGKVSTNIFDCGGTSAHSLPIRNGKEFIYPILLELLNYIQRVMKKAVVITSGHRCPIHNKYVDASSKNMFSKHLIGAEVSFYIKGAEKSPDAVLSCIEDFYRTHSRYAQNLKEYLPLVRYDRETDTSLKPWMNKEIFIKFYLPTEGRNRDNTHPYGYFSLQVRFDRERQIKVTVTPQESEMFERY